MTATTFEPLLAGTSLERDLKAQIALELNAVQAGVERYRRLAREAVDRGEGAGLKPAERLLLYWLEPLKEAVRQEQRGCKNGEYAIARHSYGPAILLVDAEKIAVITMHEVVGRCMACESVPVAQVAYSIGAAVIAEASLDQIKEENRADFDKLTQKAKALTVKKVQRWTNKSLADPIWSRRVAMHMGACLLWHFIQTASSGGYGDGEFKLSFRRVTKWIGKKRKAFVEMDQVVRDELDRGHAMREHLRPIYGPMLVPPCPWSRTVVGGVTKKVEGGYLKIRTPYTAKPTRAQKKALSEADLSTADACLNSLSRVSWAINRSVVEVVEGLYRDGGGIAGVPPRDDRPRPERPAGADTDESIKKAWKREASQVYRQNMTDRSDRTDLEVALQLADSLSSRDRFYLPHQFDFRSRVYPIPTNLSHHKDDLVRSMLTFGRPVDASSDEARWELYVHAANCAGIDKVSFDDRVKWVDEWLRSRRVHTWIHDLDKIKMVAAESWADPDIDNPLQFLAALLAIYDPEQAARLPIQRDGTCSALQHYAALAGDTEAATICNLVDAEKPSGVYVIVAQEMNRLVAIDADNPRSPGHESAVIMRGRVTKDFSKLPVMTTRYGATAFRVHDQMFDALLELSKKNPGLGLSDWKVINRVSEYLRGVAMQAIGSLCKSADRLMDWLKQSARAIAVSGEAVRWNTPIGFPVVQPYMRYTSVKIVTIVQEIYTLMDDRDVPVQVSKQARSCAPNFIHSLDAAHGLTTSLGCDAEGIDMALVHDSFWSHAATTARAGEINRQKFVELHSKDQAQELYRQWSERYPKVKLLPPPPRGGFDLNHVLKARYAFS